MKIAQINMTDSGSTGKIMLQSAECARNRGYEVLTFSALTYTRGKVTQKKQLDKHIYFGYVFENKLHTIFGMLTGRNGMFSYFGTKKLIKELEHFKPDILQLHNLHKFCINLPMLFKYIKKNNIKVVWTLHDCWSFTGRCPHFEMEKCDKWKTGCYKCTQKINYPKSYVDKSKEMYALKKKWLTGVKDMTIITPSQWLADLVKQSYLKDYPVKVINNGIDLTVFKPTASDFREKYNLGNKKILLGVAFGWGKQKGLDVFIELSKRLSDDYRIVLVGTNDALDEQLPQNIISIHRTQNQTELAEIYSAADLFVNPTREDTFPTVNLEAFACGTPIITFKTGGSPEAVTENCGVVVECDDIEAMLSKIRHILDEKLFAVEDCVNRAKNFDMNNKFKEYVELYEDITYCSKCPV